MIVSNIFIELPAFQKKAEGKAEKQWEIVLRMQKMGLPIETICQATGLSEEEIKGGSRLDRE